MRIDKRLDALSRLSPDEFERLVRGYTRIANDFRFGRTERIRARRRLRLLQLSRVPTGPHEVGVN